MDSIKEMRTLSNFSYDHLLNMAIKECGFIPKDRSVSKIEIINLIITYRASKAKQIKREKYCLETPDDGKFYLELTEDQINLLDWLIKKGVCLYNADCEQLEEIEWETP